MLFEEKMLLADLILSKEIGKLNSVTCSLKESGKTRFDGIINTAGGRSKQHRHFSTRWQLSISQFFTLSAIPSSQWLSKIQAPAPHSFKTPFSTLSPAMTNCRQTSRFHLPLCCRLAVYPHINCSTAILLFYSHLICEVKNPPYY